MIYALDRLIRRLLSRLRLWRRARITQTQTRPPRCPLPAHERRRPVVFDRPSPN